MVNKPTFISTLLISVSVMLGLCCQSRDKTKPADEGAGNEQKSTVKINYYAVNEGNTITLPSGLYAQMGNKKYTIIPENMENGRCMQVFDSLDFDQDGYEDALITHIWACGGNGSPNAFFFCSYSKDGTFRLSEEFGESWDDPLIEMWNGKPSVKVISNLQGMTTEMAERTERFILENGRAVRVEYKETQLLPAIVELKSADFTEKDKEEDREKKIYFDLDGDGKKDKISGRYWERWGSMLWDIRFGTGKYARTEDEGSRKRIGVLNSKTKGVHDIVLDLDDVMVWDGEKYVYKK